LIANPIIASAHPIIMNIFSQNKNLAEKYIKDFTRLFILISIPSVSFLSFFHKEITELILGPEFHEGSKIFPIILVGFIAWNLSILGHKGHEIKEKTKEMFIYVIVAAIINIILNFLFVPSLGYLGAALATMISYMLYPIFILFSSKKYIKWDIPFVDLFSLLLFCVIILSVLKYFLSILIVNSIAMLILAALICVLTYYIYLQKTGNMQFVKKLMKNI
jgi:O-antigen/teichoic acid export membrane protein